MTDHPVEHAELAALAERFLHGVVSAVELSTLVEAVPALLDKVEELTAERAEAERQVRDLAGLLGAVREAVKLLVAVRSGVSGPTEANDE